MINFHYPTVLVWAQQISEIIICLHLLNAEKIDHNLFSFIHECYHIYDEFKCTLIYYHIICLKYTNVCRVSEGYRKEEKTIPYNKATIH